MNLQWTVAVRGWSLYLPGLDLAAAVPELAAAVPGWVSEPAYPPEQARHLLGRRGLLNKDPATRLALCAVHRALGRADGSGADAGPPRPRVAVVASSNCANLATVTEIVRGVRTGDRREISPMAAPNASPNAVASAVAIWFRCGGPNLMLASGRTSGLDALAVGALLLRAGRADTVLVVGAEPGDEVTAALHERAGPGPHPVSAAACVVLESASVARDAVRLGPIHSSAQRPRPGDVQLRCGELYGALGVAQVAVAAAIVGADAVRVVCGDETDGWRVANLHRA